MVINEAGAVIVSGYAGGGFPTTPDAFDTSFNGGGEVFVARLVLANGGQNDLLYSTYLGTSGNDFADTVTVHEPWDVVIGGLTNSPLFPVTEGAYDTTFNNDPGTNDAFVARFDFCPIDLNDDGVVGIVDFLALLAAWGPCPDPCPPFCFGDIDGDCNVGITDFLALLAAWGPCP